MENQVLWRPGLEEESSLDHGEEFASCSQCNGKSWGGENREWHRLIDFCKGVCFWLLCGVDGGSQETSHRWEALVQVREDNGLNQGGRSGRGKNGQS